MSELHIALDSLINKYKNNDYIMSRIEIYMKQLLPAALENENKDYMHRLQRKQTLNQNRIDFVERFLYKNKAYKIIRIHLTIERFPIDSIGPITNLFQFFSKLISSINVSLFQR